VVRDSVVVKRIRMSSDLIKDFVQNDIKLLTSLAFFLFLLIKQALGLAQIVRILHNQCLFVILLL